jgi:glucose-1-phosphate adenylyltransferase
VRVNSYAEVDRSILFSHVSVGRYARLRRCIIERGVSIPENAQIGYDEDQDRSSGFTVTDTGIVVVSRGSPLTDREQAEIASLT